MQLQTSFRKPKDGFMYPLLSVCFRHTQSQKKCNFSSWIFPGAPGQGHVTRDREKSVCSLVYTLLQKKHNFKNVAILLRLSVIYEMLLELPNRHSILVGCYLAFRKFPQSMNQVTSATRMYGESKIVTHC